MRRRRAWLAALGAGALAVPFRSLAQQASRVWRVGYIDFGSRQSTVDSGRHAALLLGLRERGYVEGRNLLLEARYAEGKPDRVDGFAAELVRLKVDLILTLGSAASRAAQRATTSIPIVVISSPDPVGKGFAASLARPGANLTGMSNGADDIVQKLVELLIGAAPRVKHIAVLTNPANDAHALLLASLMAAARQTGKQATQVNVSKADEIDTRFAGMTRERIDAVIILADAFLFQQRAQIAALALKHRMPSIYALAGYAEVGGLMSYGADNTDNFRRSGVFVDRIFKGARAGDVPFEQPLRYYYMINRKTADALGIVLTDKILLQADKVIE